MLNQVFNHFNIDKILHDQQYGVTEGSYTTVAGVTLLMLIFTDFFTRVFL